METERQYLTPTFIEPEYTCCSKCEGTGKITRGDMPAQPGEHLSENQLNEIVNCNKCDGYGLIEED